MIQPIANREESFTFQSFDSGPVNMSRNKKIDIRFKLFTRQDEVFLNAGFHRSGFVSIKCA